MNDDRPAVDRVADLQEPPTTSLTGPAREVYLTAKQRVADWNPVPPPRKGRR